LFPPGQTWGEICEVVKKEKNPVDRIVEMRSEVKI
jgi:hypothetical protein